MSNIPQKSPSSSSNGINRSPRFTTAARSGGQTSSAKRHSFSRPETLGTVRASLKQEDSQQYDDTDLNIPGAFPNSQSGMTGKGPERWSEQDHAGHDHRPLLKVDLPTHEQPSGAREGVGSLPGPNNALGVAILPDERKEMEKSSGKHIKTHRSYRGHPKGNTEKSQLPSKEVPSGSRVGVGSLPGKNTEAGVATLPEERVDGKPLGQNHTGFEDHLDTAWKPSHRRNPSGGWKHGKKSKGRNAGQASRPSNKDSSQVQESHKSSDSETLEACNPIARAQREQANKEAQSHTEPSASLFETREPSSRPMQQSQDTKDNFDAATGQVARHIASQVEHAAEDVIGAVEGVANGMYQGASNMLHNMESYWAGQEKSYPGADKADRGRPTKSNDMSGSFVTSGANAPTSKSPRPPSAGHLSEQDITQSHDAHKTGKHSGLPKTIHDEYLHPGEYDMHGERLDMDQFIYDDDMSTDGGEGGAAHITVQCKRAQEKQRQGRVASPLGKDAPPNIASKDSHGKGTAVGVGGVEFYTEGKDGKLPGYPTSQGMETLMRGRLNDDRAHAEASKSAHYAGSREDSKNPSRVRNDDIGPSIPLPKEIREQPEVPVFRSGGSTATGKYEVLYEPISHWPEETDGLALSRQGQMEVAPARASSSKSDRATVKPDSHIDSTSHLGMASHSLSDRIVEERREIPVFRGGESAAEGKYEAMFQPVTGRPEELAERPEFKGQPAGTAAGKYEATFSPEMFPSLPTETSTRGSASTSMPGAPRGPMTSDNRAMNERHEVPIFRGGGNTAQGKFEARFEPVTGKPEEVEERPVFKEHKQSTAAGEFEAVFNPVFPSSETSVRGGGDVAQGKFSGGRDARGMKDQKGSTAIGESQAKLTSEVHGSASYLGKPVSKAEEQTQIEEARRAVRHKAGVN